MSRDFEEKVERLAFDLRAARTGDATNLIREELQCHPQETLALIRSADQANRGRSVDHVVIRPDGDILITDPYRQRPTFVGQLPPVIQDRNDNYYRGQNVPRYGDRDRDGCFGNGNGGYDNRGYDNRGYDNRDYDNRDYGNPNYGNPNYGNYERPPRPPIYVPGGYDNSGYNNGYPPQDYSYPRNNTGLDIAVGVIGGIVLDRALGGGHNYHQRRR